MSDDDERQLPRLGLLRELTDQHVLEQLLDGSALTRAEIAGRTGISKPTISESVRRLEGAGLLTPSGQQSGRRGPNGTYFRVRPDAGAALAVSVGPEGVVVERFDVTGRRVARVEDTVEVPTDAGRVGPVLVRAVRAALPEASVPVRSVVVSVAGPVDQASGRLVALPDSPFLLGELRPRELLAPLLPVVPAVDNDVNWAALAEHHEGGARNLDEFFYAYLGPGVGGASFTRGAVRHGAGGLAGELAHVITTGPDGRALRLVACLDAWGLLAPGSPAVDVARVRTVLEGATGADRKLRSALVAAVAGALASVTALLNPRAVVVGGTWGQVEGFVESVTVELRATAAVPTAVRGATLGPTGPLVGARIAAVRTLQGSLGAPPDGARPGGRTQKTGRTASPPSDPFSY